VSYPNGVTEHLTPFQDALSDRINGTTDGSERSYLGTVNSVPFPGPDGYPAWSLLLTEARPIRKISPLGRVQFDLALTTAFRPTPCGWQGLYFSDTNTANGDQSGWYYVGHGESPTFYTPGTLLNDKALYDERDLHDILNVAPPPPPPPPPPP
jgi:hypothetical protein